MQIRTRQNVAAALAGIAMVGTLAGCSGSSSGAQSDATEAPANEPATGSEYADGEYTATGDYVSPGGPESVTVTLTLSDNTITELEVTGSGSTPNARKFQGEFINGIDEVVVGKSIDGLAVSKVAGSSLTSGGFNKAIEQIKDDAS